MNKRNDVGIEQQNRSYDHALAPSSGEKQLIKLHKMGDDNQLSSSSIGNGSGS